MAQSINTFVGSFLPNVARTATAATMAFFQPHGRSIGGIIAQVTIEEQGSDDLQITEHPVEQGAPIADHAFKRPATVTIRAGWSRYGATPYSHNDLSAESGVYGLLLSWQAALLPFNVITGKRSYSNMLIERLQVSTDQHSEYALMATITCRQVIIVGTSTAQVQGMSNSSDQHANPESTGPSSDTGDKASSNVGSVQDTTGSWRESDAVTPESPQNITGSPEAGTITPQATTPEAQTVEQGYIDNGAAAPNNPPVSTPTQVDLGGNPATITGGGTIPPSTVTPSGGNVDLGGNSV